MKDRFELVSPFQPAGDQPEAIRQLIQGIESDKRYQTLLGVTGSGKTFTMANVIAKLNRPALILSHNKTLAAQLFGEFRDFFPNNAVRYFVSYYDYYQPEAYIPQRDIYIEKETSINAELDRLRLASTSSLVSRRDVIIVASVSCIYGLGSPADYKQMVLYIPRGGRMKRDEMLHQLVAILYDRKDFEFSRGTFRVRGDTIEIWPAYEEFGYRVEMFGDEIERITLINPTSGQEVREESEIYIYPAKHFVLPQERVAMAVAGIRSELEERLAVLRTEGKLLEAQRLASRTTFDLEMLAEVGHCPGIENYSRYLAGREPGARPSCLLDFFPPDYLLFIDESHVTLPQVQAMYAGDRSRKMTLVEHGFRLPSALDNRPLRFDEWELMTPKTIFVSATPGPYELEKTGGEVIEQVIRPTGLLDPVIEVHPARGQVPHLLEQVRLRTSRNERCLITTLTKRLAEDLANFFQQQGIKAKWLHSELDALERVEILRDLREGIYEAIVGINLLREGLDLPEVSLVAILDADKEGFLRSETSLIQTIGRAARNQNSLVLLYADQVTPSMQRAMDETDRRRQKQMEYNTLHNITPESVRKAIHGSISDEVAAHRVAAEAVGETTQQLTDQDYISELEKEMFAAAERLEFERAAKLRDKIDALKAGKSVGKQVPSSNLPGAAARGKGRRQAPKTKSPTDPGRPPRPGPNRRPAG